MDIHGAVVTLVNGGGLDVRQTHVSIHVKVNWVSTETESLAGVEDLEMPMKLECNVWKGHYFDIR